MLVELDELTCANVRENVRLVDVPFRAVLSRQAVTAGRPHAVGLATDLQKASRPATIASTTAPRRHQAIQESKQTKQQCFVTHISRDVLR